MAETKSTKERNELRPEDVRKIQCGERHFQEALGVGYEIVTSVKEIQSSWPDKSSFRDFGVTEAKYDLEIRIKLKATNGIRRRDFFTVTESPDS